MFLCFCDCSHVLFGASLSLGVALADQLFMPVRSRDKPELEFLGVFPTHPCAAFHRLLCTWTHRTASPERPWTRLVACGTITQTSTFSKQPLPTPYACTLRSHPQRPVALPLGVPRGSGHARLGKGHRALTISGATTPCEHHVATTSLFKHPSACRDKTMWLALRFTQQVPIPQTLANTHHHQTTSHHDRLPDFVVGRAHALQQDQTLFYGWDQHLTGWC